VQVLQIIEIFIEVCHPQLPPLPLRGARPNPDGIKHVAQWGTDIHSLIQESNV